MTEKKQTHTPFTPGPHEPKSGPGADNRKIIEAIVELNVSRKNISFYPPNHDQVKRSIERALDSLSNVFENLSSVTLGIAGDSLFREKEYLEPDNPVCKDFALSLKRHDIAAVSFQKGLQRDELARFLSVISQRPEEVEKQGGIETVIEEEGGVPNIKIRSVDYSKLHIREKEEGALRPEDKRHKKRNIWKEFVSNLLSETIAEGEDGVFLGDLENIDPAQLAELIGKNRLDADTVIQFFDRVISGHFSEDQPAERSGAGAAVDLANWNALIEELNPELKSRFLSLIFTRCLEQGDSEKTEEFMASMSGAFVLEMLRQADEEGKEMSPALLNLIRKMAGMKEVWQDIPEDFFADFLYPGRGKVKTGKGLGEIFKHEDREKYIQSDYNETLERLSNETQEEDPEGEISSFRESFLGDLEEGYLNSRVGRLLIAFMSREVAVDEYRVYADKLLEIGSRLLEVPDFAFLSSILKTFQVHKKKRDQAVRSAAEESLKRLRDPSFTSKAVGAFFEGGNLKERDAYNFFVALGPGVVPDIVKMYARQESPHMPGLLPDLFSHFRERTVAEAKKRLRDDRVHFVRNLVVLLRFLGAVELENRLKPLLDHENTEIRMETLDTLLSFNSQWALSVLKTLIKEGRSDIASKAISLAGKYRLEEAVPELTAKLRRFIFFRSDIKRNLEVISALGLIGAPVVIPDLEKIAKTSWPLYRAEMKEMKRALFESLESYPYEYAKPILDYGSRIRNEYINTICKRITEKQTADM